MKQPRKYLQTYYDFIHRGFVPGQNGLCQHFRGDSNFVLMWPTLENIKGMELGAWWAEDIHQQGLWLGEEFGPTRQNIVLLMAAMNGEL